jgi:hypothetical protein
MDPQVQCPGCDGILSERELRTSTFTIEACPRCGATVRQGGAFHQENLGARLADEMSTIAAWVDEESTQLRLNSRPVKDRESFGEFLWRLTGEILAGCQENWVIEVVYSTHVSGVVAVRITTDESTFMEDEELVRLTSVFRDHALQPHATRSEGTRWGVEQYLSTSTLSQGLMRPCVTRLLAAMRDAMTTRERQAE